VKACCGLARALSTNLSTPKNMFCNVLGPVKVFGFGEVVWGTTREDLTVWQDEDDIEPQVKYVVTGK
jgi:hypothetical protein